MSSRDDSIFDTGMTSAVSRKITAVREKREQSKLRAQTDLLPGADQLRVLIADELASIYDVRTWGIKSASSSDDIRLERRAKEMHEKFVKRFQTKVNNILRTPIRTRVEVDDEA